MMVAPGPVVARGAVVAILVALVPIVSPIHLRAMMRLLWWGRLPHRRTRASGAPGVESLTSTQINGAQVMVRAIAASAFTYLDVGTELTVRVVAQSGISGAAGT